MKGIKLKGKKGLTVWDLSNVAFTLVFIGVAISIGMWTNDQIATTAYGSMNMNDSINFAANDTYYQLSHRVDGSVINIENTTVSFQLGTTGNWTCQLQGYQTWCLLNSSRNGGGIVGTYNVNYNGFNSSSHYITMNATEGMYNLAQWLPIVMVVFAAAIVLAALAMWFGRR